MQTCSRVLEAFSSWLILTPGGGLPGSQLAQHPLVTAALEGLDNPETFDDAVEALVELIYSTSNRGAPDQDSMSLVSRLVPAVSADCCRARNHPGLHCYWTARSSVSRQSVGNRLFSGLRNGF